MTFQPLKVLPALVGIANSPVSVQVTGVFSKSAPALPGPVPVIDAGSVPPFSTYSTL